MSYTHREIVWAKPQGYPWWPAIISKLPENNQGNFKVLFIAEDNYAMLDPKNIRKYQDNYQELSKNKTKKLQTAIIKADTMIKAKKSSEPKNKKKTIANKIQKKNQKKAIIDKKEKQKNMISTAKNEKKNTSQVRNQRESDQEEQEDSQNFSVERKKQQSFSNLDVSEEASHEKELKDIDKQKIQKIEGELNQIIGEIQRNLVEPGNYTQYFAQFDCEFLSKQELNQSSLTRMIRYIIVKFTQIGFAQSDIDRLQFISESLKDRTYGYLSDTGYYDQYLRIYDKNKETQNKSEQEIKKIIKKENSSIDSSGNQHKIKQDNINIFASLIGQEIGKGGMFRTGEFLNDLKNHKYELRNKLTSKAASHRFAESIIHTYI